MSHTYYMWPQKMWGCSTCCIWIDPPLLCTCISLKRERDLPLSLAIHTQRMTRNPALSSHVLAQFTKTQSKSSTFSNSQRPQIQLIRSPKQITLLHCNHTRNVECEESNHGSNGLTFVWGRKLLSELSTWGIGGLCNCASISSRFLVQRNLSMLSGEFCFSCVIPFCTHWFVKISLWLA